MSLHQSLLSTIVAGNVPGSGALMTFKDSSWLMSSVVAAQPHFVNQPADQTIFWGYGLHTEAIGDYVKKPMKDCTGQELLNEYLHHLHIPEDRIAELMKTVINVIPCYMPYVTSFACVISLTRAYFFASPPVFAFFMR